MATLFRTPTTIPLDAFTQFAVHAKPNSNNPIGHFGTGLKYAVAIILRHGGQFKMWVDGVEYEFYTYKTTFRGSDIETIRFRKKNGLGKWLKSYKLPFTTELGKNWGLWQAYRELLSNTFDEGGSITVTNMPVLIDMGTVIQVDLPGFDEAGKDVWLPHELIDDGRDPEEAPDFIDEHLEVWKRPSKYIYCKGVRVHELPIPSFFTYNFTGKVVLSEDRSLMNQYAILEHIANWLDRQNLDDIRELFTDKDNRWFEAHELSYYHLVSQPAGSVRAAARLSPSPGYYLSSLLTSPPENKDTWNLDVHLNLQDVIEFVQYVKGTVVQDTNLCSEILEWVLNDADLLEKVREDAAEYDWELPLLLQP